MFFLNYLYRFGLAGWGRLSISLYILHIEKWLEHFKPDQFLIMRLEDYEEDPKKYMERVFTFLGKVIRVKGLVMSE